MNILRKSLVMLAFALVSISAMAEQFCYLTFETKDGAKASVAIESLTMTISGTTLVAGNQIFVLDNLSKMYFLFLMKPPQQASDSWKTWMRRRYLPSTICRGISYPEIS